MRTFVVFVISAALLWGCSSTCLVRDEAVYRTEMDFMEQAALQPAASLEIFIQQHCVCVAGQFTTDVCRDAADKVVTVQARVPWHKAMSLYLGGLSKKRPPKEPPVIPLPESLCLKRGN